MKTEKREFSDPVWILKCACEELIQNYCDCKMYELNIKLDSLSVIIRHAQSFIGPAHGEPDSSYFFERWKDEDELTEKFAKDLEEICAKCSIDGAIGFERFSRLNTREWNEYDLIYLLRQLSDLEHSKYNHAHRGIPPFPIGPDFTLDVDAGNIPFKRRELLMKSTLLDIKEILNRGHSFTVTRGLSGFPGLCLLDPSEREILYLLSAFSSMDVGWDQFVKGAPNIWFSVIDGIDDDIPF